jgi:chromosomal replication initiation ATPase DnaA
MKQLSLPFAAETDFAPEDFCAAPSNAAARALLAAPASWSGGRLILWGAAGAGKTHLLHIWARETGAALMPGPTLIGMPRAPGPVAIDDADILADPPALLHLLNAVAEAGHPALMTARLPPARQPIKLADLASRLRAASAVEIRAPEDELLALLLTRLTAERQLSLSIAVQNYLLTHLPRTAAAMREAVARLDRAVAERHVRLTRLTAAEILYDLLAE